ncbi:unnamed protein product [Paramecium sonneborni]|uniref:Uncharacterized protein n=1 Tax=Paramecium sonneborni TaxID=65129 RepID=A0A8S1R039_9CILI|nr:unnamed protein product [Paramecium sonneborni]
MGRTNKNYQTEAQDFEFGQYFNNFKWNYIYENIWIYEGYYNEQGQKNGKQFELNDVVWEYLQMYFFFRSLVIYNGEQNNWKQVGKWDILKFLQNYLASQAPKKQVDRLS